MQILYVVQFEIESSIAGDPYASALSHVVRWLTRGDRNLLDEDDLSADGELEMPAYKSRNVSVPARHATWEFIGEHNSRSLRISLIQDLGTDIELTTRVTLSSQESKVVLRVGISREQRGDYLSPTSETPVFQPGLVTSLSRDTGLILRMGTQRLDGRYLPIRTSAESDELIMSLRSTQRLPLVLIHLRSAESWDAARHLSSRLVGLARVVTLNHSTSSTVSSAFLNVRVPVGGLQLVWSNIDANGPVISGPEVQQLGADGVRARLIRSLAGLSALARGNDAQWRQARVRSQSVAQSEANERVRSAIAAADTSAELEALREQVNLLQINLEEWKELAHQYEDDAQKAETRASTAVAAEESAVYWRQQYETAASSSMPADEVDPWGAIPALISASDPEETYFALEDASGGRIVFTDAAHRSWKNVDYPDAPDMTANLERLARAACELYGDDRSLKLEGRLDDWFKTNHQLNIAMSDDKISKSKRLRNFEFDGASYDQTPHVKVRDGVKPNEVGRIHFALDSSHRRIVVNHVALKLYGI